MAAIASYHFATFELDVTNAELRRDGLPVKLAPQPFAALVLLVERAGTLVTREDLRHALWGDDRHVDVNAGVNFCMAQLRAALGDDATALLQTVPRRGYRFVGAVKRSERAAGSPPRLTSGAIRLRIAVAAAIAIGAIGVAMQRISNPAEATAGSSSLSALAHREHAALGLADTSPGDLPARIAELRQAIEADPSFARAYSDLAEAHLMQAEYRADAPQLAYANAKAAAIRAMELQPRLGEAHAAYAAAVLHLEWNWAAAKAHFALALRDAPDSPRVLYWYSRYLAARGRPADAVAAATRAVEIDPSGVRTRANLGFVAIYARRYALALTACEDALALLPKFTPARFCAASAAIGVNALDKAVLHASSQLTTEADMHWLRSAVAKEGTAGYWRSEYRQIEAGGCDALAVPAAIALARLGDSEQALHWLERAAELHADTLIYARVQPAFDGLHGTARFEQVLRRIGLGTTAD